MLKINRNTSEDFGAATEGCVSFLEKSCLETGVKQLRNEKRREGIRCLTEGQNNKEMKTETGLCE